MERVVPEKERGALTVVAPTTPPFWVESNALAMEETVRLVVLASVAVMLVVDAYGIESAEPVGAAKLMVRALPPTNAPAVPEKDRAVPAVMEEVATDTSCFELLA